jgi:serine/threonine-protein kinase RsbW
MLGTVRDMGWAKPMSKEPWTWQCEHVIANDVEAARHVLNELLTQLKKDAWAPNDIFGVHLAMEEALVNAIMHGNRHDDGKHVTIRCCLSPRTVHIEISDEGEGFDPNVLPDPTDSQRLHVPGGRGVMLMREFMSSVEFNAAGNKVVMEKRRHRLPRK